MEATDALPGGRAHRSASVWNPDEGKFTHGVLKIPRFTRDDTAH